MKQLDAVLLGIVFVVWGALALMYATIPMIYMPSSSVGTDPPARRARS